jgi:hypothetical protein
LALPMLVQKRLLQQQNGSDRVSLFSECVLRPKGKPTT